MKKNPNQFTMAAVALTPARVRQLLARAQKGRVLVIGDVMLDHFLWGKVARISPEAPVPVVEFDHESYIPGGAGNVARNLADLKVSTELIGVVGRDESAARLRRVLRHEHIGCAGLVAAEKRRTTVKTRIIAHRQQVTRVDRESRGEVDDRTTKRLTAALERGLAAADAVILCDYAKGVVSQEMFDTARSLCRARGIWLSVDPKPGHRLNLSGASLLTPNRKEAFELAGIPDEGTAGPPASDAALMRVAEILLREYHPALLLVTLGDQGMLLCQQGAAPFHVPTVAREVFDVSGAGDTVIASFTAAIAAGASPVEAAIFSNHAAGVVVGKLGTATVTPEEVADSIRLDPATP